MNIWIAASTGDIDLVESFLKQGCTANDKDENGYTPVHAAAAYGHIDLLRKLLSENNGDVNIPDADNDTPLHHCEDKATAQFLIEEMGANFSLLNSEGKTCFEVWQDTCDDNLELLNYIGEIPGQSGLSSSSAVDNEQLKEFKESIRYTLENDPVDEADPEAMQRRAKLESIIQGENAEEELEKYVRSLIHNQFFSDSNQHENDSIKRVK